MEIKSLVRKNILNLKAYSSARSLYTKGNLMDANENPYPNTNDAEGLNRYPDGSNYGLRSFLAAKAGLSARNCAVGNGSDELLDILIRIFCEPGEDNILITSPTYGMYEVLAKINAVAVLDIPLLENFELNLPDILTNSQNVKIIFLCRPNNPTGNVFKKADVLKILQTNCLVVVDEAYAEFMEEESIITELFKFPNLIVLKTLSKAYALAGARLGYLLASAEIIELIQNTKLPYNVNALTTKTVYQIIDTEVQDRIEYIKTERQRVAGILSSIAGVKVFSSEANYLLFKIAGAEEIFQKLIEKEIIIRSRTSEIPDSLRVTIGTKKQNDLFIKTLKKILQ